MSIKDLEKRIKRVRFEKNYGYHIFSNENRRKIFRELTRRPCRTVSSLSKELNVDSKVVLWHINKLLKLELIKRWVSGRTYYYPYGLVRIADMELFKILNSEDARKILLHAYRGCTDKNKLPVNGTSLYRYLKIYREMGFVNEMGIKRKYVCGTANLKKIVDKYDAIGREYRKSFMELIESQGFSVRVLGTVNYELKLEISGMENFTMGIYISPLRTAMEVYE